MEVALSLVRIVGALLVVVLLGGAPLSAQELKVGLRAEPSALDPQYQNSAANNQIANHLFEPLVARDSRQRPIPALATSWKPVGDTVWEFKLRPGVKFRDGSDFTADDAVFTFERVAKVPNSPAPFTLFTRQMTKLEIVDPLTLRIHTAAPAPFLPFDLSVLPILSRKAAAGGAPEGKTTAELDLGEGLVGTGPFTFESWQHGGDLVLKRNDKYWGSKPAWETVIFRPLRDAATRLSALRMGEVDLIENPPTGELASLAQDPKISLAKVASSRLIFVALDQFAAPSPGIPNTEGKNPLKDRRVREALSRAIDRQELARQVLDGTAQPAGDFLPFPAFGTRNDAEPDRLDETAARALLSQAGYADGFSITLGSPKGRYVNDLKVAQTVAAMWSRVGVKTEVEAAPPTAFFKNRDEYKYSAYLAGWGADSGEMSNPLRALVATPNREKGMGGANRGRYSSATLDSRLDEAMRTLDDAKRETLLQEASRLAIADYALLPLYFELQVWAMRDGLAYDARADAATLAQFVTPTR